MLVAKAVKRVEIVSVVMADGKETSKENVGDEEELRAKKNSTSVIWKYFGYKRDAVLQKQVL